MCVTVPNFIKIGLRVAKIWRFNGYFLNGGRPPSWICWALIGSKHDDHLVFSIVVPNLVEIDGVVSIPWNFQYFARLAWKRLFTSQKLGISPPNWGAISTKRQKAHPCASPRRLSHQAWKSVDCTLTKDRPKFGFGYGVSAETWPRGDRNQP